MTPKDVIKSFYQKGQNDCTTLGTIKVAITKFGIDNVFSRSFDNNTQNYSLLFKNGQTLVVSKSDIEDLYQYAGFEPNFSDALGKSIFEYALFCFGVFVINYARMNNNMSIQEALFHIDSKGINSDNSYHYLGFNDNDIEWLTSGAGTKDYTSLVGNEVYVLSNFYHTVMATYDAYDEFGTPTNTSHFAHNHSSIFHGKTLWAYKFK